MQEKQILIGKIRINYKITGKGEDILILHGWGSSSDSWIDVQNNLIKKGYRVICPDLPGFGKSDIPLHPWSISDYLHFVLNFSHSLGLKKFYLLGHSLGGRIAVKVAAKYPEKIIRLILCNPAGIKMKPNLKIIIISFLSEMGNFVFDRRYLRVFKDFFRNIFHFFLRHKDYVKANEMMKETMKIVLAENLSSYLPEIKAKTLIVWGEIDKIIPLKIAYIFSENIKSSELIVLPKIGHSPHLETPEKLSEIIDKFIKS